MRIKTKNKIIEVSNIEFDHFDRIIRNDDIFVKIDSISTFNRVLDDLLTQGYADLSDYSYL